MYDIEKYIRMKSGSRNPILLLKNEINTLAKEIYGFTSSSPDGISVRFDDYTETKGTRINTLWIRNILNTKRYDYVHIKIIYLEEKSFPIAKICMNHLMSLFKKLELDLEEIEL